MKVSEAINKPNFIRVETYAGCKTYFFKCLGCDKEFGFAGREIGQRNALFHNPACYAKHKRPESNTEGRTQ